MNLKEYDLVITTSFENDFTKSGHLYELIDYHFICRKSNINSILLLSGGIKKNIVESVVKDKYEFSKEEYDDFFENTIESTPKILICNNLCVVDGFTRFGYSIIYTENLLLFRCSQSDFSDLLKKNTIRNVHILQDFEVYSEQYCNFKVVNYTKKILWSKYKKTKQSKTNTAMFYSTKNCRKLPINEIERITKKYNFENYILLTDDVDYFKSLKSNNFQILEIPTEQIFEKFDCFIYTSLPQKFDCSPRFVVECALFDKQVIYEIDYFCRGLEARKKYINNDLNYLTLKENDFFIEYIGKLI